MFAPDGDAPAVIPTTIPAVTPATTSGTVVGAGSSAAATVVLGIDPGLTRCGYALLERRSATDVQALSMGVIRTEPSSPLASRLAELHVEIEALMIENRPIELAIERIFFQVNARTAMSVAQASGVVLALAARRGLSIAEYSPNQVKDAVAGWGGADKKQIRTMVLARLRIGDARFAADATDAAAIALCHIAIAPFTKRVDAESSSGSRVL